MRKKASVPVKYNRKENVRDMVPMVSLLKDLLDAEEEK